MKRASIAIFMLAFTIRVALVLVRHDYLHPLADETVKIARSINETGVFGNPWIIPTGATASYAPFQPYLITRVSRIRRGAAWRVGPAPRRLWSIRVDLRGSSV